MPSGSKKKPARKKKSKVIDNPLFEATSKGAAGKKRVAAPEAGEDTGAGIREGAVSGAATIRELTRRNKELRVRVKELELERMTHEEEAAAVSEDITAGVPESQGIISIVKDLEEQLDAAFALKEALERDLAAVRSKLEEETATRGELAARVELLEAQVDLVEQLRDELSFVEEERNSAAKDLKERETQLTRVTLERDALAKEAADATAQIDVLERDRCDLEAQVLNLEDKVVETESLRRELAQTVASRDRLMQEVKDLAGRLDASETSRKALELDLKTSREAGEELRERTLDLEQRLDAAQTELASVRDELEEQQFINNELVESNRRLERDAKSLRAKNEAINVELEAKKAALHEVHSAAARTTKRIHRRYYGSSEGGVDE